ncbi:hypothetical protein [Azospirillum sp. B4]|uniref:hypothetical protein n=1 Tax=Azospirillum sp. B4 TaxID=95605 RepID=UPI0003488475|nr:hypothetical protein [Azospirillum sp. B4]
MAGVQTPPITTQAALSQTAAGAGAAPTVLGQVTVTQLPEKLTGLARALAVSGMVTEQQGDQATLRTAAGDVQVRSDQTLPTDRPVILQIPAQSTGTALTATVVAQSAAQNASQAAGSAPTQNTTQPPAQTAAQAPALPTLQVGTTLAAVLLNPAPANTPATSVSAPTTSAPPSDINQGLGLGLIVSARGDTGDQPDLTDGDGGRQSPSQPAPGQSPGSQSPGSQSPTGQPAPAPTTAGSQTGNSQAAIGQGAAPQTSADTDITPTTGQPAATPSQPVTPSSGSLADLLAAGGRTGGQMASAAGPMPSLADLLPDVAPPAPLPPQAPAAGGLPANFAPSTPAATGPGPAPSQPTNPSAPASSPPAGSPSPSAVPPPTAQPSTAQPTTAGATTPPAAAPMTRAATLLAALGVPDFLPDLGKPEGATAARQPSAPTVPSPPSGVVPTVGEEAPFVTGGLFLNTRPGFVRTGLPSGTAAPFSPLPAPTAPASPGPAQPPTGQSQSAVPVPGVPVPGVPVPGMGTGAVPPAAGGGFPMASPATTPTLPAGTPAPSVPAGQAGPSAAMGGGVLASVVGSPATQPAGMVPAAPLLPGALAPQAADLASMAAGPSSGSAPAAGAYASPLNAPGGPAPGQTISFTLVSLQRPIDDRPGVMPKVDGPGDGPGILPPVDTVTDPVLARPGVAPTVPGTVVALTRTGQPVVETPRGTFLLQARTDLPPGTKVELAPAAAPAPDLDAVPPAIDPARGRDWPALREALAVIAASNPSLAHQLIDSVLPRPTPQLTKTLVVFLAALRGGDASGWLGSEAMSTLGKAGRGRLSTRLADDFSSIAAQAAEPNKDGWRIYAVPFGDEVGRLQVHVRAINEDEEEEEATVSRAGHARPLRRFLIDLQLSQLGPMQLDGLIWTSRFDLVIRTRQLLPASLTRELHGIYSNSLAAVGYTGSLAFQTGAHGWVDHAAAGGGGPVTRI